MTATGSHVHFYSLRGAQPYTPGAFGLCYAGSPYRPSSGPALPDHRSRGMTATGSHIDFGFAARSTTLQGKAFLRSVRLSVDFYHSVIVSWRVRHASPLPCSAGGFPKFSRTLPPSQHFGFSLFSLLFSLKKQGSPSGEPWLVNSLNGQTGSDTAARRSPSWQGVPDGSPAR